jgi:predicted transposase/invertase (TIGR01784 family)
VLSKLSTFSDIFQNEGLIEGEKLGIEKGRKDEKIEIAKHLLKNNVPLDVIASSTGLTIKEIEALKGGKQRNNE